MDARKGNIYEILNGSKQFVVPVYQRYYSWDKSHCSTLWNDIVSMQKNGKSSHFVGSIVNIAEVAMPTGVQKYMVIDGQQRMTTMTLLLLALREYADTHPEDTTINGRKINNVLLKNNDETGDECYKLLLTENDRDILKALIDKRPIGEHLTSRILSNYHYFEEKISEMNLKPAEIYEAIGKLQIVNITLERSVDDPQAIFESLNSTGKALSESDLIRNYVLMGLDPITQLNIYNRYWRPMENLFENGDTSIMDRFFRDYLTIKLFRIPTLYNVYNEFKQYHRSNEILIEELCKDLYDYAKLYTDIYFCRSSDKELNILYSDIKALQMEVAFPFLLSVHKDFNSEVITRNELIEIVNLCVSYVVRRNICSIPPNSLNKTFATLSKEIHKDDYLTSIKAFFVMRNDYKIFPNDELFISELITKDIYHLRISKFILSRFEIYNNKVPINFGNFTIEHIMPQNPNLSDEWKNNLGNNWHEVQKKYLHTIGNLTLTAYNPEMSDKPFDVKMNIEGGFKQSALRINGYVVMQNTWNETKILERADILAKLAVEIWPFPQISESELEAYKEPTKVEEEYTIEHYYFSDHSRQLYEILNKRIMNISSSVIREYKKLYVAYKLDTNFVDIETQKQALCLYINMKFEDIKDPDGMCTDISNIGHNGNGEAKLYVKSIEDIDKAMNIIEQSYNQQAQ